nr:hypothetical protein [Tanacetum cinerariifolium]
MNPEQHQAFPGRSPNEAEMDCQVGKCGGGWYKLRKCDGLVSSCCRGGGEFQAGKLGRKVYSTRSFWIQRIGCKVLLLNVDQSILYDVSANVDTVYLSKSGNGLDLVKTLRNNKPSFLNYFVAYVEKLMSAGSSDAIGLALIASIIQAHQGNVVNVNEDKFFLDELKEIMGKLATKTCKALADAESKEEKQTLKIFAKWLNWKKSTS